MKTSISIILTVCAMALATTGFAQEPPAITEAVFCKGIQDREPVDAGDVFSNEVGKVYFFNRSSAVAKTTIKHVWYLEGEKRAEVTLNIGASPSWRTSSSKTIRPIDTGLWRVNVLGPDGELLETATFVIQE